MARTPRRKVMASYSDFLWNRKIGRSTSASYQTQMKSPFSIPETPRSLITQNPLLYKVKSPPRETQSPKINKPNTTPKTSKLQRSVKRIFKDQKSRVSTQFQYILQEPPLKELRRSIRKSICSKKPPTKVPPSPKTILKSRNEVMENILVFSEPNEKVRQSGDHRPIVIDGCNVAHEFADATNAGNKSFLWRGVQLCIEFFSRRGHDEIVVFVPRNKAGTGDPNNKRIIDELSRLGHIIFTPSRTSTTRRFRSFSSYDDRYIVQYATIHGGIIISNDNYYDLIGESQAMCETIKNRVLKFNFVGRSTLMFPLDPLGKSGPTLYNFLRF
uniref:RNase NYN domain-containing protein n=1 Tax=Lepeophtheirus salmonis TaxID=72036 RepID=A0A0K2SWG0_LEPSM